MSETLPWKYWVWENRWRVLARYATRKEALAAAKHAADPAGTFCVCKEGSTKDRELEGWPAFRDGPRAVKDLFRF